MKVKVISYMLITLLTLSVLGGFIGYSLGEEDKYIKSVENFIKYYLDLADEKGIELPNNYMEKVNRALAYIEKAKNESNPYKAYKLILEATLEFSPVYFYIQSNIDMEYTIDKSLYIEVINSKRDVLIQMNKTLERFEDTMVICVEVTVMGGMANVKDVNIYREMCIELDRTSLGDRIREALDRLEEIEQNLDRMSPSEIEEALSQVNGVIANITVQINDAIGKNWRGMGMIQGVSIASRKILESIVFSVNLSIRHIEAGDSEAALDILRGLENRLDAYIRILDKSIQYAERFDISDEIVNNVKELINTISNVKDLVSSAISALEAGDSASALNYLEQALGILQSYISNYGDTLPVPKEFISMVVNSSVELRNRIKVNMRRFIQGDTRSIERMIDNLERQINQLVRQYEAGLIPKPVFINMLNNIKATLMDLKEELTNIGGANQSLIDRVDQLLNYIDELITKYS